MPLVNVIVGAVADARGAGGIAHTAVRTIRIARGRVVDEFKEADHPRAENGQFGAGGAGSKAQIVTTHDTDTGETTFHHVGADQNEAAEARDRIADGDEAEDINGDDSAEHHAVRVEGTKGERGDAIHIVHAADGAGGVDVHGAYLNEGSARGKAHDLSKAEWEEHGATYADAGLNEYEAIDLATTWNDEHAGDHDDVQVKVDDDGDPILDEEGGFQFIQDGEDVEPTEDMVAAFDGLREEMYPEDDVAAYPGFDQANDHFEAEGRHEAVFRIHKHEAS